MSVERLPSGGWRCRWRDAQGKERSKGSRRWRKRDAEAFERKMLDQRDKGMTVVGAEMTVTELADAWLTASRHLADSTRKSYRQQLDHDILPALGGIKIAKLTAADIDAYLDALEAAGRARNSQRRHLMSILSPMCNYARRRGYIAAVPTADVETPRPSDREMRFLTMAELKQLAAAFPERWQNLVLFAGIMGPRYGEVWRMSPNDVQGNEVIIRGTKSKTSLRRVTMPGFVQEVMADQLANYASSDVLWASNQGTSPGSSWRERVWRPSLKESGIPPLRFHDLRHTAVALAIAAGGNPLLVQKRLGHASITVTLGLYGHLFPGADGEVADALDVMWKEQ